MKEADLLHRAKRWDRQALAEIYDGYSPGLYAYALRLLGDECLAEDCVSETFKRFLHALRDGKGPDEFLQAYLYRISHNWITDHYRWRPPPALEFDDEAPYAREGLIEGETERKLQQEQVRAALLHLTPEQRQVVLLKFVEGWENAQVAAALNKPVGAIKSLQHRALGALKRTLAVPEEVEENALT